MPAEAEIAVRLSLSDTVHVHTAAADNELGASARLSGARGRKKLFPARQNALVLLIERRGIVKFTGLALDRGFHITDHVSVVSMESPSHAPAAPVVRAGIYKRRASGVQDKERRQRRLGALPHRQRGSQPRTGLRFLFFHTQSPSGRTINAVGILRGYP